MTDIETVRHFAEAFLGKADAAAADATVADDVVVHTGLSPAAPIQGLAAYKQILTGFAAAFPVHTMEIHEIIAAGPDRAVLRFTAHARHVQDYYGIAATGREVRMHETHLIRLAHGRIAENFVGAVNLEFEMIMAPVIAPMVLS